MGVDSNFAIFTFFLIIIFYKRGTMRIKRMPICQTAGSHQISLGQKIREQNHKLTSSIQMPMYVLQLHVY